MHQTTPTSSVLSNKPNCAQQNKPNPALERLHAGVTELLNSQVWQDALKFKTRFHTYSFNNALLIYLQRPDATLVAGYRRWQKLGRQVCKGETSLAILAPIICKVADEGSDEKERRVVGFRSAHVFDVSQTDGEPLPEMPSPTVLEGDSPAIRAVLARVEAFAASRGLPVCYRELREGVFGLFSVTKRTITVRADLPPLQTLKTLVHELAHALLHAEPKPEEKRHLCELEAESCAFLVLHELGLDTSRYTFPYLASWAENPDELLVAGEKAARAAAGMVAAFGLSSAEACLVQAAL